MIQRRLGVLLASGYLWEESRLQRAYKPLLTAERKGRGLGN